MASVYLPGFIAIIIIVALVFSIYYSGKALKLWGVPLQTHHISHRFEDLNYDEMTQDELDDLGTMLCEKIKTDHGYECVVEGYYPGSVGVNLGVTVPATDDPGAVADNTTISATELGQGNVTTSLIDDDETVTDETDSGTGTGNEVVSGCMNSTATNYNSSATVEDNTACIYTPISGCMDQGATNYDSSATVADNTACLYPTAPVPGCTDSTATNYVAAATEDDGSCVDAIYGCTTLDSTNYNAAANTDDGSCIPFVYGCTDPEAFNYLNTANTDDGSCIDASSVGCMTEDAFNYNAAATTDDGSCIAKIHGCINPDAFNYDATANVNTDDGSCIAVMEGCTDPTATNYTSGANTDDGSCIAAIYGCTTLDSTNYNAAANTDDGSCVTPVPICTDPHSVNHTNTGSCGPDCIVDYMINQETGLCELAGCMDATASNYAPLATVDDESCIAAVSGCTDSLYTEYNTAEACLNLIPVGEYDELAAWGINNKGQLGIGNTDTKYTPTPVTVVGNSWESISGGYDITAAIKGDGSLWTWGYNNKGQLGIGTEGYDTEETEPQQVGSATTWESVACGDEFMMAIKVDGTLWTWGSPVEGPRGLNTDNKTEPTQVGSATNWESVSCGVWHAAAIKDNGTLWAWGKNEYGQLGIGNTTDQTEPTQVGSATTWESVSCGFDHTAAMKPHANGRLYIYLWGRNHKGQLGLKDYVDRTEPTPIGNGEITYAWKSVSCGKQFTMAIRDKVNNGDPNDEGELWGWGQNDDFQLGLAIPQNNGYEAKYKWPQLVNHHLSHKNNGEVDYVWESVACGDNYTVAIKENGTLWSWGRKLGFGDNNPGERNLWPVQVNWGDTSWESVAAGAYHAMCIKAIVAGCIDAAYDNYDPLATMDNGSCVGLLGCMDPEMFNYNSAATVDTTPPSCVPIVLGCLDEDDANYDAEAGANTDTDTSLCSWGSGGGSGGLVFTAEDWLTECDSDVVVNPLEVGLTDPQKVTMLNAFMSQTADEDVNGVLDNYTDTGHKKNIFIASIISVYGSWGLITGCAINANQITAAKAVAWPLDAGDTDALSDYVYSVMGALGIVMPPPP